MSLKHNVYIESQILYFKTIYFYIEQTISSSYKLLYKSMSNLFRLEQFSLAVKI
jgi:hypothetical protein